MKKPGSSNPSLATPRNFPLSPDRSVDNPWDILKLLADATRLRIVALLCREELSVAELQEILGMGQSRISSHLAILRKGSVLVDRREGKKINSSLSGQLRPEGLALVKAACATLAGLTEHQEDQDNLAHALENR